MSTTTTRGAFPAPELDDAADIEAAVKPLADRIAAIGALYATGTAAARPAASSANVGTWYIASDSGAISVSNGTSWVQVSPVPADGIVASQITDGTVGSAELAANAVTTAKITDANVTAAKLAANAVTTAAITDANVTAAKLAANAVTTAAITDANVTLAKLAADSVNASKIVDGTVGSAELAANAVTTAKITDANVTTAKIADSNVTTAKINNGAVTAAKLATAYLEINGGTARKIAFGESATGGFNGGNHLAHAVAHGLGSTPVWAIGMANYLNGGAGDQKVVCNMYARSSTHVTFTCELLGAAQAIGTTIWWAAIV